MSSINTTQQQEPDHEQELQPIQNLQTLPQQELTRTQRCFAAVYARNLEYLEALLAENNHRIDEFVDGFNLLHECLSCNVFTILPTLFEHPLIVASCKQKDINGMTPLTVALSVGSPYWVVESLLDAYPEALAVPDQSGWYPIHYSTRQNPSDVTSLILRRRPVEAQRWLESNNKRQLPIHLQVSQYKGKTFQGERGKIITSNIIIIPPPPLTQLASLAARRNDGPS